MLQAFFEESILKKAIEKGIVNVHLHDLRNFAAEKAGRKQVDDYAYGGGAGMVLMPEPIFNALEAIKQERTPDEVIFLTPDGEVLSQATANQLSLQKNLVLICGRYKGIDERIRKYYVTKEISIGDYVLTGGEIPAAALCDAVIRLIPGVMSDESSALSDSFQAELLDAPVYTRPRIFNGHEVPEVLFSGNHRKINDWRHEQSLEKTQKRRPDLLD